MNKKTISAGLLASMALSTVLFTSSANAFWPFDGLFNKGEVKAATTEKKMLVSSDKTDAIKLSTALNSMKSLCADLFKTVPVDNTNREDDRMYKNGNTGVVKPNEQDKTKNDVVKNMSTNSVDKKIVAETGSVMALMKNICKQINGYNDRFDRVYKTMTETSVTPTVTPTVSKNVEKKPFIKFFEGDSNKKQAR